MIKFAVMTFMYNGWVNGENGSHEELIKILAEAGADGMEAFCNTFMDNADLLKLYQRELKANQLAMPVMDLIANLACADRSERREVYETMRKGIDICDALDAEIVHLAGCRSVEEVSPDDGRKWIAEGLADFVDDVEKRGMTLAFEDFDPSPDLICSAADCLDILKQTDPRVKFVFDTGNFRAAGECATDNFAALFDHTCHFHFKDYTYFGQGEIKNREVIQKIKDSGYSGWVALESYPQDGNGPREVVAKELGVLKEMFSSG